jgi:heme A synthase
MIRILVQILLPLIAPALLYWLIARMAQRRAQAQGKPADSVLAAETPWSWLIGAGLVLAVLVVVLTQAFEGGRPGAVYEPPRYEDGRIIPGRVHE